MRSIVIDRDEASSVLVSVANALRQRDGRKLHTDETDGQLTRLYQELGSKWRQISKRMGGTVEGFSDDVCRNRMIRLIRSSGNVYVPVTHRVTKPNSKRVVREKWNADEDELLFKLLTRPDATWMSIKDAFPNRTRQGIRNRSQRVLRVLREERGTGSYNDDGGAEIESILNRIKSQVTAKRKPSRPAKRTPPPAPETPFIEWMSPNPGVEMLMGPEDVDSEDIYHFERTSREFCLDTSLSVTEVADDCWKNLNLQYFEQNAQSNAM